MEQTPSVTPAAKPAETRSPSVQIPGRRRVKAKPGDRHGRLTLVRPTNKRSGSGATIWESRCDCGGTREASINSIHMGLTRSCGCLHRELAARLKRSHGHSAGYTKSRAYRAWQNMIKRCTYPSDLSWKRYGGRGIRVCDRWKSFEAFLADMGVPAPGQSLDRVNFDGNYEPENCRWASRAEQSRNKSTSVLMTFRGETLCLSEWADRSGLSRSTFRYRYRSGESLEELLSSRGGAA